MELVQRDPLIMNFDQLLTVFKQQYCYTEHLSLFLEVENLIMHLE